MTLGSSAIRAQRGIAFVGNYTPRKCGIATFTRDLVEALAPQSGQARPVDVCAMNDIPQGYAYPQRVKFEVRQEHAIDYSRAADFLNFSRCDVVSLQHEFGIYGGEAGSNILTLLRELHRPFAVTCHTVLQDPQPEQAEVFKDILGRADKVVVMTAKALQILQEVYGVGRERIALIPHGIHDMPFIDPSYYKDKFGVEGRRVLSTFGLLSRNKGIEYVVDALPRVIEKYPNVTYIVLGATHPVVLREEGESYRLSLKRRARELGVENHILFHPRFVETDELLEYLGATDIFVTPYLNLDQITSGVLTYAMGAGKAVVSTPYWHAEELLGDGRGRLVPPKDSKSLAREIVALFDDEVEFNAMRKRAYLHMRASVWPAVANDYLTLFDELRTRGVTSVGVSDFSSLNRGLSASELPVLKLEHLERMSDDTGIARHARWSTPDWSHGYWAEDAAGALVAATKFHGVYKSGAARRLAERYLGFLQYLGTKSENEMPERMTYSRQVEGRLSEDGVGKMIWSLGYTLSHGPPLVQRAANELFARFVPNYELGSARGSAYAVLGCGDYLLKFPGASDVKRYLERHAAICRDIVEQGDWPMSWESEDWPVVVQALNVTLRGDRESEHVIIAEKAAALARELTGDGRAFEHPSRRGDGNEYPSTASAFIEGLGAQFERTRDRALLRPIRFAVDWFLGANARSEPLFDFGTAGCHDGLTARGLNDNQGTEATVSCLLAFLTLHELARVDPPK